MVARTTLLLLLAALILLVPVVESDGRSRRKCSNKRFERKLTRFRRCVENGEYATAAVDPDGPLSCIKNEPETGFPKKKIRNRRCENAEKRLIDCGYRCGWTEYNLGVPKKLCVDDSAVTRSRTCTRSAGCYDDKKKHYSLDDIHQDEGSCNTKNQDLCSVSWENISGDLRLKQVSTGKAGVWGVAEDAEVYKLQTNKAPHSWTKMNKIQRAQIVLISSGDKVWGLGSTGTAYSLYYNYSTGAEDWTIEVRGIDYIDVSDKGHVWGCSDGDIYRRVTAHGHPDVKNSKSGWEMIEFDGLAFQVSVGEAGVWVMNYDNEIFYREGTYGDLDSAGTEWTKVHFDDRDDHEGETIWPIDGIASGKDIVVGFDDTNSFNFRVGISADNPTGEATAFESHDQLRVEGLKNIDVSAPGWSGDEEEVLVIVTDTDYNVYMTSVNYGTKTPSC